MRHVVLTEAQFDVLLQTLGWVEAAGAYSELAEQWNGKQWRSFETMAERVRKGKRKP